MAAALEILARFGYRREGPERFERGAPDEDDRRVIAFTVSPGMMRLAEAALKRTGGRER